MRTAERMIECEEQNAQQKINKIKMKTFGQDIKNILQGLIVPCVFGSFIGISFAIPSSQFAMGKVANYVIQWSIVLVLAGILLVSLLVGITLVTDTITQRHAEMREKVARIESHRDERIHYRMKFYDEV